MNKCIGCGLTLQSDDKNKKGYVPSEAKNKNYCQSCFRLMHYGINENTLVPKENEQIINYVNKKAKEVFFITDFISVCDKNIDLYKNINVKKKLIVNKSDIIPTNISFSQIKAYLKNIYSINEEVIFTNKFNNNNSLIKKLYGKEVYFLGASSCGKSSLINNLLVKFGKDKYLSESYNENTTKEFIKLSFPNFTIYDSPGFYFDMFKLNKKTNIDSKIKPINYNVVDKGFFCINEIINLGIEGDTNLIFYFSKIKIRRSRAKTLKVSFDIKKNSDILIFGLGFIKTTSDITLKVDKSIEKYIIIRKSITGGKYSGKD